ncbi:DUF805 domain-containing protein [Deltaproteobacteria bacterium Smac51]|nr:DUF805 domain-containing protein [Deltaproteobacteria bacterium Smac51]
MNALQMYFIDVLKTKYFQPNGRARRKEYWMFYLFYVIAYIILAIISSFLGENAAMIIPGLFALGVLLPMITLSIRRLHDIGKSGWWLLICLVPLVGSLILLVFTCLDSQPGANQYGPNPKGVENPAASDVFV